MKKAIVTGITGQEGAYLSKAYTVRQFAEYAFNVIGIDVKWEGSGVSEIRDNKKT